MLTHRHRCRRENLVPSPAPNPPRKHRLQIPRLMAASRHRAQDLVPARALLGHAQATIPSHPRKVCLDLVEHAVASAPTGPVAAAHKVALRTRTAPAVASTAVNARTVHAAATIQTR